jgi:hypothetical protein
MDDDDLKLLLQGLPTDTDIRNFLEGIGYRKTDSFFAISSGRGFDYLPGPNPRDRFFIYRREREEDKVLSLFDEFNIPHFTRIETTDSYSVVKIPFDTRPLAIMKFSEQSYTDGAYLGAFEAMALLGKFLKRLKTLIHALPQDVSIASFALVPGEGELMYLVPPLLMGEVLSPQTLEKQFLSTFNKIDPFNNHKGQVRELMRNYL